MWAIIKFDKNRYTILKEDLKNKIGDDFKLYRPKFLIEKFKNNKLVSKEVTLLGDYLFIFHKNLNENKTLNNLKFLRGLKYFLDGFIKSQKEIINFINQCKKMEDKNGYISRSIFENKVNKYYKFSTGPFTDKIFKIVDIQKNKIDILMGNINTKIKKTNYLYSPI